MYKIVCKIACDISYKISSENVLYIFLKIYL